MDALALYEREQAERADSDANSEAYEDRTDGDDDDDDDGDEGEPETDESDANDEYGTRSCRTGDGEYLTRSRRARRLGHGEGSERQGRRLGRRRRHASADGADRSSRMERRSRRLGNVADDEEGGDEVVEPSTLRQLGVYRFAKTRAVATSRAQCDRSWLCATDARGFSEEGYVYVPQKGDLVVYTTTRTNAHTGAHVCATRCPVTNTM